MKMKFKEIILKQFEFSLQYHYFITSHLPLCDHKIYNLVVITRTYIHITTAS